MMLKPALRPPMRAPLRSADSPREGVGGRTSPLRVSTFGDSLADYTSLGTTDVSSWSPAFSAGTTVVSMAQQRAWLAFAYPQAHFVGNGGISGQTTTQMIARSGLGASSTRKAMEDVIALTPHVVLLRAPINDLTALSSPIIQANLDAIYARLVTIIDTFANAGIWVLSEGPYGYSGATNTAEVRAAIVTLNAMLAGYSRSFYRFIDINGVTHDGTGAFISGMSNDNTHLSNKGGYRVAKLEAAALRSIFGVPVGPRFAGTNLIPNADLSASGAQGYGTVGTNWGIAINGSGTRANAKIETINGVVFQTCEFTPSADNAGLIMTVPFGIFGASPTIAVTGGLTYGIECDIYIASIGGGAPPSGTLETRINLFKGTPRNVYSPLSPSLTDGYEEAMIGRSIWSPIVFPDFGGDQNNLTSSSDFRLVFALNTAADRTPFKLGIGNPRFVLQ